MNQLNSGSDRGTPATNNRSTAKNRVISKFLLQSQFRIILPEEEHLLDVFN